MIPVKATVLACAAGLFGLVAGDAGARIAAQGYASDRQIATLVLGVAASATAAACSAAAAIDAVSGRRY